MKRLLPASVLLLAIPLCVWVGVRFFPELETKLRLLIQILIFVVSFPPLLIRLCSEGGSLSRSVPLLLSGTVLRVFLLFPVGFSLLYFRKESLQSGLYLYLVTVLIFLFFELVSLIPFKNLAGKGARPR